MSKTFSELGRELSLKDMLQFLMILEDKSLSPIDKLLKHSEIFGLDPASYCKILVSDETFQASPDQGSTVETIIITKPSDNYKSSITSFELDCECPLCRAALAKSIVPSFDQSKFDIMIGNISYAHTDDRLQPFDRNLSGSRPAYICGEIMVGPTLKIHGLKRAYVQGKDGNTYQVMVSNIGSKEEPIWRIVSLMPIIIVENNAE